MRDHDPWYYPRGEFSQEIFRAYDSGLVRRIAMFAPRRKGKTWFLIRDLAPAAVKRQYIPVYASLWAAPDAPQVPIIQSLQATLNLLSGRRTPWKKIIERLERFTITAGVASASWAPRITDPLTSTPDELGQISGLMSVLVERAPNQKILLMIDEAQHLATHENFSALTHCLRTALDTIEAGGQVKFRTLFTGSSRTNLSRLLNDPGAPFYHSTEQIELPDLTQEYTDFIYSQLKRYGHGKGLTKNMCWQVFKGLDCSPYYMERVLRELLLRRSDTMEQALLIALEQIRLDPELAARWSGLRDIDRLVYFDVCSGESQYTEARMQHYSKLLAREVGVAMIQNAIRRLLKYKLISKKARGQYRNEDSEFLFWIRLHKGDLSADLDNQIRPIEV